MTLVLHSVSDDSEPLLTYERPGWHKQAACHGAGTDAFYPGSTTAAAVAKRTVATFCARCPVSVECAAAGDKESHGVWGGRLRMQAWRVAKARRISAARQAS